MEVYRDTLITPDDFDQIADILINHTTLSVGSTVYTIREIEFYLVNEKYNDKYTHKSPEQQLFNGLYLHKFQNGTFKSGTFKGLDLTYGNQNQWLGILIRGLMKDDKVIDGPCLCVNDLLSNYGAVDIKTYVQQSTEADPVQSFVTIKYNEVDLKRELIKGCRIGLSDKYPESQTEPYRYGIKGFKYKRPFTSN